MASNDGPVRFLSGNERLARALAAPERRAQVDAILSEQDEIDRCYRDALQILRAAVVAAASTSPRSSLRELQQKLSDAGIHDASISLTFEGHHVKVPIEQIITDR